MASSYGEAVLDFDLDFLHQNNDVTVNFGTTKLEKVKFAVLKAKKKIIATNSLITKYNKQKEEQDQIKKELFESKEECKQVCINHRNELEKSTNLEESERKLRIVNQELEERCAITNTRYSALQSHTNQLQLLIKEDETKYEAIKIEVQLQKSITKELEKKISSLAREKAATKQHMLLMKDIVLGKKKLNKKSLKVLKKYKGTSEDSGNVSASDSDACDSCLEAPAAASWEGEAITDSGTLVTSLELEPDFEIVEPQNSLESPLESILHEKVEAITSPLPENLVSDIPHKHTDLDHDSDGSCKIVLSVDTGRGSSLAFSDSEKCFLSPDRFSDDNLPDSSSAQNNEATTSHSDITSSPAVVHTSTSNTPRKSIFDDLMEIETVTKPGIILETSEHHKLKDTSLNTLPHNLETVSNAVRFVIESPTDDEETNQFEEETCNGFLKPPIPTPQNQNRKKNEMHSLDFNNINTNLISDDENSNDCEVSSILNKIRLHYSKISPLPPSPTSKSGSSATESTNQHIWQELAQLRVENKDLRAGLANLSQDQAQLRVENKDLRASVANLSQDMMVYKSFMHEVKPYFNPTTRTTTLATDGEVSRQTIFPNLDEPRKFEEVSRKPNLVDKKINHCVEENQEEPSLAQRKVERQNREPCLISTEFEKDLQGAVNKPIVSKSETVSDKEIPSEMQTEQFVGENHERPVKALERSTSPVYGDRDWDKTVIDAFTANKEVKMDETAKRDELLIQLSDHCDDAPITNMDENQLSELCISDKPSELLTAYASSETPVINTSINSHQNKGRAVEKLFFDEPALTEDNSLQVHNLNPVKNTSVNMCRGVSIEVEKRLFDDPAISEDDSLKVDNVQGPVDEQTLFNNCDINLKLDDVCNNNHTPKKCRKSKLTKLEKIRKRLQPKNKIKVADALKKSTIKLSPKNVLSGRPNLSAQTELNNKAVYEKALAVVAELRAKKKTKKENTFIARSGRVLTRSERDDVTPELQVPNLKIRQSPRLLSVSDGNKEIIRTSPKGKREINMSPSKCETNSITTRSRSKGIVNTPIRKSRKSSLSVAQKDHFKGEMNCSLSIVRQTKKVVSNDGAAVESPEKRSSLKRPSVATPELETKRKLRNFNGKPQLPENSPISKIETCAPDCKNAEINRNKSPQKSTVLDNKVQNKNVNLTCKYYGDMDMFTDTLETVTEQKMVSDCINHPKDSILCRMIEKHGIHKITKFGKNNIPANITDSICKTLEQSIASIKDLPAGQSQYEIDRLVVAIRALPYKHFLSGITKFLKEPARKTELFNKINYPPAPPMTKTEQILLCLISQVKASWAPVDIVNEIMAIIEFSLFRLGQAPEFQAIESLSHFYAVLCRFTKAKNRLRLFILDAMYCLTYKAIPLINICLDVWMHVLPLSHMRMAHSPLVICIVYLIHYYKCEDEYNRVHDIRFLLKKRYSFDMTEWNETKMLNLLKNAILELRENPTENKMLRTALIIFAKRQGTKWCQENLLRRILLPLIDKHDLPERAKEFCVSMLGPLMKPYPNDMKVYCEIVLNQLLDMLEQNSSQRMQEAILTSLLYIQRHDPYRVTQALLSWRPQSEISRHLEDMLREFVRYKPIKVWTRILAQYASGGDR